METGYLFTSIQAVLMGLARLRRRLSRRCGMPDMIALNYRSRRLAGQSTQRQFMHSRTFALKYLR